jgi:hypothetical protein
MTDISGKTVMQKEYNGIKNIDLDIMPLPDGVYMIQMNGDGATGSFKILKH